MFFEGQIIDGKTVQTVYGGAEFYILFTDGTANIYTKDGVYKYKIVNNRIEA